MNKDIRINVGFFQHHKTKKLIYKLDYKGVIALLSLWTYAAQNKPKGILSNMDEVDIALSACWEGDAGEFVNTLVDIGFLEDNAGTYSIHDWERNNPYAFHADERSEHARKAANARYGNTDSMPGACPEHAEGNAPSPSPSPVPSPKPEPIPEEAHKLALLLFELMKKNDPKIKEPNFDKWSISIERLNRIDARSYTEIEAVIRWCQIDEFWHKNILSADKLRKQFTQLFLKMQDKYKNKGTRQKLANDRDVSEYMSRVEGPE